MELSVGRPLGGTTGPHGSSPDFQIEQALRERPDQPVRIRIQPQVYMPSPHRLGKVAGRFMTWRGLYWNVEVTTLEDAQAFRKVLTEAFKLMATVGPEETLRRLTVDTQGEAVVESAVDR